ncbi:MAG: translocation/assembly module TamB domain-containing protein [Chitinophagaceae bacterium]|nr:translocation/assembly module TamB domain-containing protein [Chitinophagaceae bacterium]MCW5927694.1 translocation/assembly module TamB domain-containing protein [Chitinophagaceae bacterium]
MTAILISTPPVQTWLVKSVSSYLSEDLGTTITVKKVSFSLVNRMNLEGVYVSDKAQDTLIYADRISVNISNFFFLREKAEVKNVAMDGVTVNLNRTDPEWNYHFLSDYFSSSGGTGKKPRTSYYLKRVLLRNVRVQQTDEWRGQDLSVSFKELSLLADSISFSDKYARIEKINIEEPLIRIYDYPARRPKPASSFSKDTSAFNDAGWLLNIKELAISNGAFKGDKLVARPVYDYFDDSNIHFFAINGKVDNVMLLQDTLTADLSLATKERSGFVVNRLTSKFRMEPGAMIFDSLAIKTPNSTLGDYYAMHYEDFNRDMLRYISNVTMKGRLVNSRVHSKDIAYFAPELKTWNKLITVDGSVSGTVDNFSSKNFVIKSDDNTRLTGNISIKGLPKIDSTYIDFRSNDLQTSYADLSRLFPELKQVDEPNLEELKSIGFRGNFTGYLKNFVTKGTIETNLGVITTDINMKLSSQNVATYSGNINMQDFQVGKFMRVNKLGEISFDGKIEGTGFSSQTMDAQLEGSFSKLEYNRYSYQNISVNGRATKKLFSGNVTLSDPNAIATLDGEIDFNGQKPVFNFFADIQRSNLRTLGFAKEDIKVIGKFDMNFVGNDIDNFLGSVYLFDVAVTRDYDTYVFDTLTLSSQEMDGQKILTLRNTEASAFLVGDFKIKELPDAVKGFLNKYYPAYISPPEHKIAGQNFLFQLDVKNIDQYLPLINSSLKGFNNSTIVGSLNSGTNLMAISAMIPHASYKNISVSDFRLTGLGNMDALKLTGVIGNTTINDSLQFPSSTISIASSNNVSQLNISTSANQTINEARLSAQITNLTDGVKIHFDPSSIVLNNKTWRINDGGEITLSRSYIDAHNIKFTNGEQELSVVSRPSEVGKWDDIIIDMKKLNMGDFLPFILNEPRMEGMVTGNVIIEDAFQNMHISATVKVDQFRLENDSIGQVEITGAWDDQNKRAIYEVVSDNRNYQFSIAGTYEIVDSVTQRINTHVNLDHTDIHFLEQYLNVVFGDVKGYASGNLTISGDALSPDYTGAVKLTNGGLRVLYTQCTYEFDEALVTFTPGNINFGTVILKDTLHKHNRSVPNTAVLTGNLRHTNFRDFEYDFTINTNRLLVLNTTRSDNSTFYGNAIGKVNFRLRGPDNEMRMTITGQPVDSSHIFITSSSAKESANADYIIWKQYGREMNFDSLGKVSSDLNVDLNLTANSYAKLYMVLDEITGDIIEATGSGNLRMNVGTNAPFSMNGRYNIEKGFYRFSFQEIFKKPFVLLPNAGSFIRWDGDPYEAEINLKTKYAASDVKLSSLYAELRQSTDPEVSRLRSARTDVDVLCTLTGSLLKPDILFEIALPPNSDVRNSQRLLGDLQRVNSDDNEKNKQVAYLIVFRSFAPIGQYNVQQTDAATFAFNTISEYISGYLSSSLKTLLYGIFKDPDLSVNFSYTRASIDPTGTGAGIGNTVNLTRDNISFQFIKSLLNDKLTITFGSDFNFVSSGTQTALTGQNSSFLFLPDITAEYKITADGKFRVSFFYRSNFDALSTTGKRNRAGGSISFRTEFDPESLKRKKEIMMRKEEDDDEAKDSSSASVGRLDN